MTKNGDSDEEITPMDRPRIGNHGNAEMIRLLANLVFAVNQSQIRMETLVKDTGKTAFELEQIRMRWFEQRENVGAEAAGELADVLRRAQHRTALVAGGAQQVARDYGVSADAFEALKAK